jgi:formate hydrogenlyase transcriptional activator
MRQPASTSGICSPQANVPAVRTGASSQGALQDGNEINVRDLFDAVPQNIYLVSADGTLLYVNRVALDYYGLPLEDFVSGAAFKKAVHPEDFERVNAERIAGISSAAPFEYEARVRRHDGEYRWFLYRVNPVHGPQGHIVRWCASGTDIDDRKRADERVRKENTALREEVTRSSLFDEIVGSSEPIRKVLTQVTKVAPAESTVLILGESGTGKELIARAIHRQSNRSRFAFIPVNCAAIPQSLIASELFGHEKGAFTGALERRIGRFESAEGGTIFLDEVGDLPAETQVLLLRVLQEREFERVGSTKSIRADVRIVAATNKDLKAAVASGGFRKDLYYRLNVFPIEVPSLRERPDDIPLLLDYFIHRFAQKSGKKIRFISNETIELFRKYEWPGNIRELQNVVERGVLLCETDAFVFDEKWLRREPQNPAISGMALVPTLVEHERELIESALAECGGRISGPAGAAAKLRIPRQTLDARIASLGINKYRFKS